jgi:hypothetical protein
MSARRAPRARQQTRRRYSTSADARTSRRNVKRHRRGRGVDVPRRWFRIHLPAMGRPRAARVRTSSATCMAATNPRSFPSSARARCAPWNALCRYREPFVPGPSGGRDLGFDATPERSFLHGDVGTGAPPILAIMHFVWRIRQIECANTP